jgi:hypothetical protein
MGATELQIFVSLVVVLGAAFVALICDFLKGSNERLREANLELLVRHDQRPTQAAAQATAPQLRAAESMAFEQALARKIAAQHKPAPAPESAPADEAVPLQGGRRRPRRDRNAGQPPHIEDWARQVMERRSASPAPISPVQAPPAPAPAKPVQTAPAEAAPAPMGELLASSAPGPVAGAGVPAVRQFTPVPAPASAASPLDQLIAAQALGGQNLPMANITALLPGFPMPGAVHWKALPLNPLATGPAAAILPRWAASPASAVQNLPTANIAALLPGLPMPGSIHWKALPLNPLATGPAAAILPRWAALPAPALPFAAGLIPSGVSTPFWSPSRLRGEARHIAGVPGSAGLPPSLLGLESELARPAHVESIEAAESTPLAEESPVVRIRVLREDPPVESSINALEDLFTAPPEPASAGHLPETVPILTTPAVSRPSGSPPVVPAWNAIEPSVPRDNVVELPLTPPASNRQFGSPLLQVPAGWQQAPVLDRLLADPLPFEGLVACVSIADFDRLVGEFGEARCEEAAASLCASLDNLVDSGDFLCRSTAADIILLFPGLATNAHSSRVRLLAELLWDFQLRALSTVPVLCNWGASEAVRERLAEVLGRAREQMAENRRIRRGGPTLLGRFRRRAVNA